MPKAQPDNGRRTARKECIYTHTNACCICTNLNMTSTYSNLLSFLHARVHIHIQSVALMLLLLLPRASIIRHTENISLQNSTTVVQMRAGAMSADIVSLAQNSRAAHAATREHESGSGLIRRNALTYSTRSVPPPSRPSVYRLLVFGRFGMGKSHLRCTHAHATRR